MTRWQVSVLAVVLLLAGCGGDSSGSSASEDYANGVCTDLSTWVADLQGTTKSLQDAGLSINKEDLRVAAGDVSDATEVMVADIKQLGPPETDAGTQAKNELDSLGTKLTEQMDTINQALDSNSGAAALATTVTTALSTAANDVKSTYESLQGLDPAGELADAFKNADNCKSLGDQVAAIGS